MTSVESHKLFDNLANIETNQPFSREKWITIAAYMLSMGVCGIVLVAIGSTLEDLAHQINRSTTSIGSVFIARGAGSVLGAILCSKLYRWFLGNFVMFSSLLGIMFLLVAMPFTTTIAELHVIFFLLGLGTAITDTGCQLMTRKLHGKCAGPWLGANATVFGLSAALVPVLEMVSSQLSTQYFLLASIVAVSCGLVLISSPPPTPRNPELLSISLPLSSSEDSTYHEHDKIIPHFYTEMTISIMLFCFVGGSISATAYIESYIDQTHVISSSQKGNLVFILWISITLGRIVGVQDQRSLSDSGLTKHLSSLCIGGFLSMLAIFIFPESQLALWVGVSLYGFFHGPTVGYCQDLNNRLTLPTEKSMAIVMFGLNCGASFVPYFVTVLWDFYSCGPLTLIAATGLSMIVPLPLVFFASYISYADFRRQQTQNLHVYESISNNKT